ncbi:hypothetical protein [Nostoc sp. PCC 7107]|uniref:hypothetical protein n=1 Tax=Nostoc sp. PCC 7107 TaxID=317936 RepID=UPI00155B1F7E|nr:hypothetical protein [Nostoc sp. PCC 7107]
MEETSSDKMQRFIALTLYIRSEILEINQLIRRDRHHELPRVYHAIALVNQPYFFMRSPS